MRSNKFNKGMIIVLTAVLAIIVIGAAAIYFIGRDSYQAIEYETVGFANMRGNGGKVYKGIGGAWGEEIPVKASAFAVYDGKIYYGDQITEGYVASDNRFGNIFSADMPSGSNEVTLADNAYNVGYGQEKLIGDKIFYCTGLDDDFNMMYAWVSTDGTERNPILSRRINNIFGYDGTYFFYSGFDKKTSKNIVGKYNLETNKDRTLYSYEDVGNVGSIVGISLYKGEIYAITMTKAPENYDDRTAEYKVEVRDTKKGKVTKTLPFTLTGAANYGFLFDGDTLIYSTADSICKINLNTESEGTVLCSLGELEYWGIPHFAPGDGYLYYETLADLDPDTGFNDYFYRVSLDGGQPELLNSWITN